MPQLQVEATLESPDSTIMQLLEAHQEICIQYGYLSATTAFGIRHNAEADLLETFCLMMLLKLRINKQSIPNS